MIDGRLCRTEINKRVRRIVRAFKWAVSEEMVPPAVHQALKTVQGLRPGRADVRESEPVRPVSDAFVDAIRPFVSRQVWAMIELQRLTGMRPGEVVIMRARDIDVGGRIWCYVPATHKTAHHGKQRRIYLGPASQAILREWLRPELDKYLFSPTEAESERNARRRQARRTPVRSSQRARRVRRPRVLPKDHYAVDSYRQAIDRGIKAANSRGISVAAWHPHQLRHNAATRLRREFGLDVARAVLGHSSPVVTEVYAELDGEKAIAAMERIG
jgi:integrase